MSASVAAPAAAPSSSEVRPTAAAAVAKPSRRDLRLDYMRGLALLLIFIDHVSGNRFAALTLQSLGFADAAEVFVFIAGLAAVYAYRRKFIKDGWRSGVMAVLQRLRTLYLAHLGMLTGLLVLAGAAWLHGTGFDVVAKLGLQPLLDDPIQAALRIPVLGFLPNYLDILPLYIMLFATLPLMIPAMRKHPLLPLGIAALLYVAVNAMTFNMPNFGSDHGWFLNPFAWALLFTAGATTAEVATRGGFARLPRPLVMIVTVAASGYVVFAFLHAAPWRVFPMLQDWVAFDITFASDKTYLSWHRLVDLAAKAWLVAVLIPPAAAFMASGLGGAITRAGRNSLPLFVGGTYLSLVGSIILHEAEGHALAHIGVTFGGVIVLLVMAWLLELRSAPRSATGNTAGLTLQPVIAGR
jgi:hypothetical protein